MKLRLLKAWRDYAAGDLLRVEDADDAKALIDAGFAEEYNLAAELEAEKTAKDAEQTRKAEIEAAVREAIKAQNIAPETTEKAGKPAAATVSDPKGSDEYRKRGAFKGFGHFLQEVRRAAYGRESEAFGQWRHACKAGLGLNEGNDSEGGAMVPTDFFAELLAITHREAAVLSRTTQIPVNGGAVYIPAINESSRVNGSRYGGVSVTWLGEGGTIPSTKPSTRNVKLEPKKLAAVVYATEELLEDAALPVEALVNTIVGKELAYAIDDAIINGTGAGQPLGIMASACKVALAARTTANHVKYEDVVGMYARLHAASRGNAVWLINQAVMTDLMTMPFNAAAATPVPVWLPPGGASDSPYGRLFGAPVIEIEQCAPLGTTGDIIYGDFSQYLVAQKSGIRADASMHVQFLTDQMAYRFITRVDGQPWWNTTLTPAKGSATQSPFVVLP